MRLLLGSAALLLVASSPGAVEPSAPAARLAGAALLGGRAYAIAASLTDGVGERLAGSPAAERAVEWALKTLGEAGLKNVHRERVLVPRWLRGDESARLVAPASAPLQITALGGSVGTPEGGLTAEVIEASSLAELKALGERVRGKMVLYNQAMRRTRDFEGYGQAVGLRAIGAVEAARLGAVAALIRSVGTGDNRLPHTGATRYDPKVPAIPYAALAAEDAQLLHRLLAGKEPVRLQLHLGAHRLPEVESANVVGEVPGSDKAEEIVLLGAHLDSWDLATGALDDAAGCAIVIEAARLIAELAPPRRTLRVVLFMNEENGLSGARAYAAAHRAELPRHAAAFEADGGAGRPIGLALPGGTVALDTLKGWGAALAELGLDPPRTVEMAGSDLIPLQAAGVPVVAILQDMSRYFDWHHTAGDTFDKIDRLDLAFDVVAYSVLAHAAADAPDRLPPPSPPPKY